MLWNKSSEEKLMKSAPPPPACIGHKNKKLKLIHRYLFLVTLNKIQTTLRSGFRSRIFLFGDILHQYTVCPKNKCAGNQIFRNYFYAKFRAYVRNFVRFRESPEIHESRFTQIGQRQTQNWSCRKIITNIFLNKTRKSLQKMKIGQLVEIHVFSKTIQIRWTKLKSSWSL